MKYFSRKTSKNCHQFNSGHHDPNFSGDLSPSNSLKNTQGKVFSFGMKFLHRIDTWTFLTQEKNFSSKVCP